MSFANYVPLAPGDQYKVNTDRRWPLGTVGRMETGEVFMYGHAGAVALAAHAICQSAVPTANHVLQTPLAAAVGARTITLTLGATAVVADEYRDGLVSVDLVGNTGFGYAYHIASHVADAGGDNFPIPLKESETVQVAIATTANSVSMIRNKMRGLVIGTTTYTQKLVGVPLAPIAIGSFGWFQVAGPCRVLTQGTVVIGEPVIGSGTTAGAVSPATASETQQVVGTVMHVAVTTGYSLIDLQLD